MHWKFSLCMSMTCKCFHCIFSLAGNQSMHLIPRAWRDSAMPCTVHTFRPFPDPSHSADNMHCTHASWLELCYESSILSGHLDSFKPTALPVLSRTSG